MRLFAGIPLAGAVMRELAAVVTRLRGNDGGLRWTAPESWHITLQFLGNATAEQLECLKARLGEVRSVPVPVRLGELGCFDRAGVFFAGVVVGPELAALQERVVAATSRCGFVAETRPFHPHITLARKSGIKKSESHSRVDRAGSVASLRKLVTEAGDPAFAPFTARELVLYESHLGPGGSKYEARMRVMLDAA